MRYDVIVAGAGPAGSTAARECAARGLSVLLLEKAEFPRDKPCGGGVNLRAARLLPFDIAPVVERVIDGMVVSVRQNRSYTRRSPTPFSFLTQRRRLDAFLAEQAVAAGALLRERMPLREVDRRSQRVLVRAGSESFEGHILIAADGANGPTARAAGIAARRIRGIALEGNVTLSSGVTPWESTFAIDVGGVPGGYGWLFPKGDHVNVGVGGWYRVGPSLRSRLESLTHFYGFSADSLWGVRGHPLPVRLPGEPLVDGNVLLVGDAAGLLDPLTGEGIYSAIWSGACAARHVAEMVAGRTAGLDGYRAQLERELVPDLWTSTQLHALFQLFPPAWAAFVERSSHAWKLICALLAGDITYAAIKRRSRVLQLGIDGAAWAVFTGAALRQRRRPGSLWAMSE